MKKALSFSAASLLFFIQAFAQFTITDNFKGSNVNNAIVFGGSPNPAALTSGVQDPVNNGWLRVTSDLQNQQGWAYIKTSFPSSLGVFLDFEYKSWRTTTAPFNGADGFSVFFFDADSTFRSGGNGGSLGYAPRIPAGVPRGLAGGYFGIGLDEFGNYSNPTEGRIGGPGQTPNAIVLRGPTTNLPATTNVYLAGMQSTVNTVAYVPIIATRPTDAQFYRRVQITIAPSGGNFVVTVKWATTPNGAFTTLFTHTTSTPPPKNLKVGFGASTGGGINNHEMRNFIITTPGGVRADKSVDKSTALVGDQVTYTINAYNDAAAPINGLLFADTLKDGNGNTLTLSPSTFTINSITFNNNGNTGNTATGYTSGTPKTTGLTNPFNTSLNIVANSKSTFTVVGTINAIPAGGIVKNSVGVDPTPTGYSDPDLTNNYFTVNTSVLSPNVDFIISKTLDNTCADQTNGNTYTITVSNNGANASTAGTSVTVKDTIPAGFTVVSASGTGWTASNVGNIYTFTRTNSLASGFSYPPITVKVTPPASGTSWLNKSTVVYAGVESNTNNNTSTITLYSKPAPPGVTSPVSYCQGATPSPLTATGANLSWYTTNSGGIASSTSPTPGTATSGNTNYYVSQGNGTCQSNLSSITVTIKPNDSVTLSSSASTTNQTVPNNTPITPITYTTGGSATGASATGLPPGVTGVYSAGKFTISGIPTASGTYNYTVTTTGGCSAASSGGKITVTAILPVKLVDFTATTDHGSVLLDWTTMMELNNTGFQVERSHDGETWSDIGFVQSKAVNGNSDLPLSYTFNDNAPWNSINYYRLKQTDLDGKAEYSLIRSIRIGAGNIITVSPNPANTYVTIKGASAGQTLRLVDLDGHIIQEKIVSGTTETFQLSQLTNAAYVIQLLNNGKVIASEKLLRFQQ